MIRRGACERDGSGRGVSARPHGIAREENRSVRGLAQIEEVAAAVVISFREVIVNIRNWTAFGQSDIRVRKSGGRSG